MYVYKACMYKVFKLHIEAVEQYVCISFYYDRHTIASYLCISHFLLPLRRCSDGRNCCI